MWTRVLNIFLLFAVCCGNAERPLVEIPLGIIKGHIQTSFLGRKFAAFEGIPYSKPPIGHRRFEAPEPPEPWTGPLDAQYTTVCAQSKMMGPNAIEGEEDCLHINVYVPKEQPHPDGKLDVVVHIHGGAFMYGTGNEYISPKVLMDLDVIFVTFNYRLGILGFLTTEDEVVPGNNGMKDQVLALKWIQNNIVSFGGNPNSVTLTGLSAGGASTHLHYLSPMSRGLFHRGFSQSGVALNTWALQKEGLKKAKMLAEVVGCSTENTKILVECLKQKPIKQLLDKMSLFFGTTLGLRMLPLDPFGPTVEKSTDAFLNMHPYEVLQSGDLYDVPWIVSSAADEGFIAATFFGVPSETVNNNWELYAPIMLDFNYTLEPNQWGTASKKIKDFYCGQNPISTECLGRMFGDRTFLTNIEEAVRLHAKAAMSPVYFYLFGYSGDEDKYVTHCSDARYFYGPVFNPTPLSENELKMKEVFFKMLTSYIKTGNPVIDDVDWKPTGFEQLTYLEVRGFSSENLKVKTVEELTPFKFWKSLGFRENGNCVSIN